MKEKSTKITRGKKACIKNEKKKIHLLFFQLYRWNFNEISFAIKLKRKTIKNAKET